jgi:HD superfamily phosphohydrolase
MFTYFYRDKLKARKTSWRIRFRKEVPRSWRVASHIVNGPIDADKHDYIMRDARHTGVPYGSLGDSQRLLSALSVGFDSKGAANLGVTEKGRVDAEFIAVSRYAMFSEVYWHHTIRSFTTMLRRALHRAADWGGGRRLTLANLLSWSDDQLLEQLARVAAIVADRQVADLVTGITRRHPYVRLWTLSRRSDHEALYDGLASQQNDYITGSAEVWKKDRELVREVLGIRSLKQHQLLWDIPNAGKDKLEGVMIADSYGNEVSGTPGQLWASLSPNFERWVRKIRLFIDPTVVRLDVLDTAQRKRIEEEITRHMAERIL